MGRSILGALTYNGWSKSWCSSDRCVCRGAQGSQGRTSWSGKPELDDYTSFAACFMHYMSYIEPNPIQSPLLGADLSLEAIPTGQAISTAVSERKDSPVVILGGYSYGSLILKNLPPVPTILQPFASPLPGSAADEILLRAHKLADQSSQEWATVAREEVQAKKRGRKAHDAKPSLTMGGEETSPEKRRSSRDVRRSLEGGASLRIKTRLRSLSHRGREDGSPATPPEEPKGHNIVVPEVRYLLISPLTPPISTLAAPALGHKFWHKSRDGAQDVVGMHPSLAIYGDQDMFTSAKKVRDWEEHLKRASASQLVGVEVPGAGHFWHEHGAEDQLIDALVNWEHSVR